MPATAKFTPAALEYSISRRESARTALRSRIRYTERERLLKPHPLTTNFTRISIRLREASKGSAALSNQSSRTAGILTSR